MRWTPGRIGAAAAAAVFALSAGTTLREPGRSTLGHLAPAPAGAAQLEEIERGEAVFKASCQTCHERRVIDVQARSLPEWRETIRKMIDMGAKVAAGDVEVLAEYLTIFHGPVPEGPGREVLLNTCTICHDLMRIKRGRRTAEEWEEALVTMLNEGAPITDDEFELVHEYLSTHFNVE